MNAKILLGLGVAMLVIMTEVSGRSCTACGFGEGTDYCKNCAPSYVVPVEVPSPKGCKQYRYKPAGDVCGCSDIKVSPVALPKPKYVYRGKPKSESCDNSPLIPAPAYMHDFGYEEEEYPVDTSIISVNKGCAKVPLYPVDAVSRDIVTRMQKTAEMTYPEETLSYGFMKYPQEQQQNKYKPEIAEEKMYTVDRQIIELKSPQVVKCGTGCDEEIIMEKEPYPISYLSYRDLGYVPESANKGQFVSTCEHSRKPCYKHREYVHNDGSHEDIEYKVKKHGGDCGCYSKKVAY